MAESKKGSITVEIVTDWLVAHFGVDVTAVVPLTGGFWSSAYAFRVGAEEFVLRIGEMGEGFAMDRAAMRFSSPDLPIPEVTEIGEGFGRHYAISRRHFGAFLEDVPPEHADAAGTAIDRLLAGMRDATRSKPHATASRSGASVHWYAPNGADRVGWRSWLRGGLVDNPDAHVNGWRAKIAADRSLDTLFRECQNRIEELLPACPERRDLVHGDLLHQNVLIDEDRVTAVFSWKCSVLGDFLFDVAWCNFWGDWHPGIAAASVFDRTLEAVDLTESDLVDARVRLHCYELQIAASHIGWYVWTDDQANLSDLVVSVNRRLDAGP